MLHICGEEGCDGAKFPNFPVEVQLLCITEPLAFPHQPNPIFESGQVGPKDGIYKEARANRRIYLYIPKLAKGTVRYVAFSPIDKLSFEPDVL
ncbi:unnamed protein product, partial [marine sediment metagenome]